MPKHFPIESAPDIEPAYASDCFAFTWQGRVLKALFRIPSALCSAVEVSFVNIHIADSIARILDEMTLSTEVDSHPIEWIGGFKWASQVEDAYFWRMQSATLKLTNPGLKHYSFITGGTCLDVITCDEPVFKIIPYTPQA